MNCITIIHKDRYQVTRGYSAPQLNLLEYGQLGKETNSNISRNLPPTTRIY